MSDPIVILGSGLAGYTVAREFRKLDKETDLIVVSADDGCFYSKPMLSTALAAGKTAAALAMKPAAAMAAELNARIRPHAPVLSIDIAAGQVRLADEVIAYSKLVLALGADPIRLPLAGDAAGAGTRDSAGDGDGTRGVLAVNDLASYARFRERLAGRRRVAILGAGLIGCEFANDLVAGKYEVDVIDIASQPLGRLLPAALAEAMRVALAGAGVRWHLGRKTVAVQHAGDGYRIEFADGGSIETDLVLSAIGLAPRTALAQAAGLAVQRGILVDNTLRTSAPEVYALGDCAEINGAVLPFVLPIMHAARVLGPVLAGQSAGLRYPHMPVVVKTPAMPAVVCPAPAGTPGAWQIETVSDGLAARFVDSQGRVAGFALTGSAAAKRQHLLSEMAPA